VRLLISPTSPYVRKVRIVAMELKLNLATTAVNPWAEDSDVSAYNPLGKIPVLVLADGQSLYDSGVIVEYLLSQVPNQTLLPRESMARIGMQTQLALADGLLDAAVAVVIEQRRPGALQSTAYIERQYQTLTRGLDYMAAHVPALDPVQLDAIAYGVVAGYVDFRLKDAQLIAQRPALARWWETLKARPSFQATQPE
jgi:glutathione S-transferase